jgi:predicted DNA binding CopG/RHH family protein
MAALGVVTRREEKQLERRLSRMGVHINLDVEVEQLGVREPASTAFKKDRRVKLRISSRDLEGIRERALEEGIPYQTLIATILLKTMSGRLVIAARSDSL